MVLGDDWSPNIEPAAIYSATARKEHGAVVMEMEVTLCEGHFNVTAMCCGYSLLCGVSM